MLQCKEARRRNLVSEFVIAECREVQSALQEKGSHLRRDRATIPRSTAVGPGKLRFDTAGGTTSVLRIASLSKNFWFILMKVVYIKGLSE